LLEHLGLHVVDEHPYELRLPDDTVWLYDVGVRVPEGTVLEPEVAHELQATFKALERGEVESDAFNRLVLLAGLTGRQVAVLRAYAKYLRQIGFGFAETTMSAALARHPEVAAGLVQLFEARFAEPGDPDGAARRAEAARSRLGEALDAVPSLDDDRVGRALMGVIEATVRTNAFWPDGAAGSGHRPVLAFKLDPSQLPELPLPRPWAEIWVASPRVEGVHLRAGPVARGGLRWSDRREDFRTEVLGLMKAQMVKNAVIVPVGAKGGFVVKQPPAAPAALRDEVLSCYRMFIEGLLDVTDNLVDGRVVPPPHTVRYDGDDPYLVVAADKGTATFSDEANAIALRRGFWLGDAFASGGSVGYDHKAMGITARGAWESVRRHARQLGKDADRDPLTVVGIGDMSGDVFGNGMLCSRHLLLVAAFDHRHIFLDPNPDPEVAYAERARLFALAGSSWADYATTAISRGGGVFPRTAKSIPISPAVRARLAIEADQLTPNELISAILCAPVDLLWNGGIGTFVKASTERHADAGDRANDAVRVDANQLRCRMVVEGGNLGLTQRARVEYALGGGAINTDAIDNSAGVDCSDHEVNLKILLDRAVAAGRLDRAERAELLAAMTDDVAELVLEHNRAQTLALQIARRQAAPMAHVHARYLTLLESEGWLDRALEALPTDKQMAERQAAGLGLTTPELAVLLAHTKIADVAEVLASDLPDDPHLGAELAAYFPPAVRERFAAEIRAHPLRREIVATRIVNQMVNLAGISFDHRLTEDTGSSVADICRAWLAARDLLGLPGLWAEIDALGQGSGGPAVKPEVQVELFLECRRMVERTTVWLLRRRRPPLDLAATVAAFGPGLREVAAMLPDALRGPLADAAQSVEAARLVAGVPESLAQRSAVWGLVHTGLDIVEVAAVTNRSVAEAAAVYWDLFAELGISWLWTGITDLPRQDRWQTQARAALRDDLLLALADLAVDVLSVGTVTEWLARQERAVARARSVGAELARSGPADLARLSVGLRQLRNLLLTSHRHDATASAATDR
jgi:glutamate dehydrogenase